MISRAELGVVAGGLAGEGARRRSASLARRIAGSTRTAVALDDLAQAPSWMRLGDTARAAVGRRAALLAIAPALARSVDGSWLRGLASVAGEDAVDWAAAQPAPQRLDAFSGAEIEVIAAGIVRIATPPALRDFVADGDAPIDTLDAISLVEQAML